MRKHIAIDRHHFRRVGSVLAAVALLATACGGSDIDATEAATDASAVTDSVASDEASAANEAGAAGSEAASPDASTETPEPTTENEAIGAADDEAEATPEPPTDPFEELPNWSGLQWGEVKAKDFEPAVSFVVPEGIGKACSIGTPLAFDFVPGLVGRQINTETTLARMNVVGLGPDTIDDTVAAITSEGVGGTEPVPLVIGGAMAVTFDIETAATVDNVTSVFNVDETLGGICEFVWGVEGTAWRFWVVDVGGDIVTFGLFATDGLLDDYTAQLQPVLDSVTWRDLDGS